MEELAVGSEAGGQRLGALLLRLPESSALLGRGAGVGWGGAEPGECSAFQAAISWLSVLEFVGNLRNRN